MSEKEINITGEEDEQLRDAASQEDKRRGTDPDAEIDPSRKPGEPLVAETDEEETVEEKLNAKVAELEDKLLRAHADQDNLRKRMQRQLQDAVRAASDRVIADLLEVVDNFERALEHTKDASSPESVREGTEMIYKQLTDLLERYQVRPIDAVGQQFDPEKHEALMQLASDEHDEGVVAEEISRGYMIGDRVLRHSKVGVSTGKPDDSE